MLASRLLKLRKIQTRAQRWDEVGHDKFHLHIRVILIEVFFSVVNFCKKLQDVHTTVESRNLRLKHLKALVPRIHT